MQENNLHSPDKSGLSSDKLAWQWECNITWSVKIICARARVGGRGNSPMVLTTSWARHRQQVPFRSEQAP